MVSQSGECPPIEVLERDPQMGEDGGGEVDDGRRRIAGGARRVGLLAYHRVVA